MEPFTKKRRLAPKQPSQEQDSRRFDYSSQPNMQDASGQAQPHEASELERFARHVHDAASLIYTPANRSQYTSVSVLLLRWEDELHGDAELRALEELFHDRFRYRVEVFNIPSCPNPGVKLAMRMLKHVEYARPGHLFIVYYGGHSYIGADQNSYWACNPRDNSPKLKWDSLQTLLEDAPSDVLLLLDSYGPAELPPTGSNGVKQAIVAYGRDNTAPEPGARSFTFCLLDAMYKLSPGPPFTVQQLHEEIISQKHHHEPVDHNGLTNGSSNSSKPVPGFERMPLFLALTPGAMQTIPLTPLPQGGPIGSPYGSPDGGLAHRLSHGQSPPSILPPDHTFSDRALVSIAFLGEPTHEMASFKLWLNSSPSTASKVTVEGFFQGIPACPSIMIMSMPIAVFNAISSDRMCSFVGYVTSHNMLREHLKLVDVSTIGNRTSSIQLEDGKILLEAAAAASSPALPRQDSQILPLPNMGYQIGQPPSHTLAPQTPLSAATMAEPSNNADRKEGVEDSDEMHEAAIQLKALSHVRPPSHNSHRNERSTSQVPPEDSPRFRSPREETPSSQDGAESGPEDNTYSSEYNSPASRPKARRSIQKQGPKQDTRCSMCSHAPFKDSSSLRKHVAAAHTRPFPCAFSFAGCTSTFGSKNEWKRHIASQHLCLTYYRCSSCPQSTIEGKGNEFNRKDLFTQHLRRMHAPFAIKKAIAKGDSKLQHEWETHVKEMQASCLVIRRSPPQRSACPKADCSNVFEGAGSWDDWTEHVGRHMEKGDASRLGVDRLLARWALDEGIIERKEDGEYRLCGTEREGGQGGYYSDGNGPTKREEVSGGNIGGDDIMMLDESLR